MRHARLHKRPMASCGGSKTMDSGTKRRLILGFISNWVSKLASSLIQLIQVPFFLHFWSTAVYGDWLIVNSIPSYLSFSNIGFGNVAGNEMTMAEARGDREAALRSFQSCWWLILFAMCVAGALVALALVFLPVATLLAVHNISNAEARWVVAFLGFSVLLGQLEQLLQSAYRAVGRYPYGSFVKSCMSLLAFACMMVPVGLGYGPRTTAMVFACANVVGTLALAVMVRRQIPWIRYGWSYARFDEIRTMAPLAFAFMGFPIGNSFNLQGTLMAVSYALGPLAVVSFATARTISRIALQMVQMINGTFEPEFSRSFAQNDIPLVRKLHRHACQMAIIIALVVIACVMLGGPAFLHRWTDGKVPPSPGLLLILLSVVLFYALWSTSSTVMYATNQHQRLALVYVLATGVTVVVTYLGARLYGLYGAAAALLLSELIMNVYVLPASLRIAQDTLRAFLRSMVTVPAPLRPQALLRRLQRSRPVLEES